MSPLDYLKSVVPSMVPLVGADLLCMFVLAVAGVGRDVIVFTGFIALAGALMAISFAYMRRRSFYQSLDTLITSSEHPRWLADMVDRPTFSEGELTYDALSAVAKSANDDVAAYRRQVEDYREYIETWVHEAKSPLAAAHLMLANLEETTADDASYERLQSVGDELKRIEGYIDQALFYARSEALDRDYLIRKYSLADLVNASIKSNASALIAAHITPVRKGLDLTVFTDEKWIEFVLGQIIQNSVKYADAADPHIEFSGRLLDEGGANECVELVVADNGCGVSAADLPRVFEKGFTGSNGRTHKRATGIGLYLVKRLCDKMDVGIDARSREGEGFAIALRFHTNKFHYFG